MNTPHLPRTSTCALAVSVALVTACAEMTPTQRGTAQGAGIGAVTGAVIGRATGHDNTARGAAIGAAAGAIAGNIWSRKMEERRVAMEQATQGTGVQVSRTQDNQLKLNIPNDISFDTGSSALKSQMRGVLDPFAASLRDDPNARIDVIGHTDSTGSDAVNDPLSVDRAQSVRDYLVGRGVSASRISTAGRGKREPVADNASESGRARNRRVEIYLREQG